MPSPEDATALKEKGNKAFKEHDWPTAINFYTQAIEANPSEPTFYTNRAQVYSAAHQLLNLTRQSLTASRIGEHQT